MMHWKVTLLVLALGVGTLAGSGCSQPGCLHDYDEFTKRAGLPCDLASNPHLDKPALTEPLRNPTTVNDTDREPYYITLKECIALALENGRVGTQSLSRYFTGNSNLNNLFNTNEELSPFQSGVGAVGSDSIRVFSLQPAITYTDIELAYSRYDTVWRTILGFNTSDQNPLGPNGFRIGQFTAFGTSLDKGLPSGGLASVVFGSPTNAGSNPGQNFYSNFGTRNFITGAVNPSYTPNMSLNFTQPLLRGFGPYVNSIFNQHVLSPNQQLPGNPGASAPGILISRVNFDQSRAEFERLVNYMVLNVEASYFQLYSLYVNLYSTEAALKQAHKAWEISKKRYDASAIPITQFAQARAQFEDFRSQRISALDKVLEQERELRMLTGLPIEDGKKLVPVDTPTVARYVPDWQTAVQEALYLRPELAIARQDIKRRQLELYAARNNLLPDLRLEASYNLHGFGTRLDGNGAFVNGQTNNALRDLAGAHFSDYNVGLTANVPLGFRAQFAALRAADMRLGQAYIFLRDMEEKAKNNLLVAYRSIIRDYELINSRRAQREAAAEQVEARSKEFLAGKTTVDFLLEAQRQWAAALAQEYQAIANYNLDLVVYQFAKGTLLRHNNIQIAEGALPECVQIRAVEHERQRAHAIVLREQGAMLPSLGDCCLPAMPVANTPTLPALMVDQQSRVPMQPAEEAAPMPKGPAGMAPLSGTRWPQTSVAPAVSPLTAPAPINVTVMPGSPELPMGPSMPAPPAAVIAPPSP